MPTRLLIACASVFFLMTPVLQADLVLINAGTDDRIAAINGVAISGTAHDGVYNFTFHHGIAYDTLETITSPVSPIKWSTSADALIVLNALKGQINAFGDVSGPRTDDVLIPFSANTSQVTSVFASNPAATNYSGFYDSVDTFFLRFESLSLESADAWVTAAVAVPELSSFIYLAAAVTGALATVNIRAHLACRRYRRNSAN